MNRALGWTISAALLAVSPAETSALGDRRDASPGRSEPCLLGQGVDRMRTPSTACMRCHGGLRGVFGGRRGAHPVEIVYRPDGYGRRLRANPERRAVNLALPAGRITCLTCHDPRSQLRSHLAARSDGRVGTRLCDACHATVE